MSWHIDSASAQNYAERTIDGATAASVEAHVAQCGSCAARVSGAFEHLHGDVLASVWANVDQVLDAPRVGMVERSIRALGCPESASRVIAATGRAQLTCLAAVVLSLFVASVASSSGEDAAFVWFLMFAPIGPLVATAVVFERFAEPVENLLRTVPTSLWTIALMRSATAVVPSIMLTALCIPILSERGWLALAWMLPSLALSVAALALSSWMAASHATLVVTSIWVALPMVARLQVDVLLRAMAGPVQVTSVAVSIAATLVFIARRSAFDYRGFS